MTIKESEEKLFGEWKQNREDFVEDGLVDEEIYSTSEPKIIFLMKEVNDRKRELTDLSKYLHNGGCGHTWNNITRWIEGIRQKDEDKPWKCLKEISEDRRKNALLSIGVVNLKKSPGGYPTNNDALEEFAHEDKFFLKRQLMLYDADLTICCGSVVTRLVKQVIKFDPQPEWKTTKRGIEFCEYRPEKYVIGYCHPAAQVPDNLLYYGLVDAIREIGW